MESGKELLNVTTLRRRLDETGPLSLAEASAIVDRLAEAIDSAHVQIRLHGGIVPENVLLLPNGGARLLALRDDGEIFRWTPRAHMRPHSLSLSPLYLTPEEARGDSLTRASDIWMLGALLYEMLTGRPPFAALRTVTLAESVIDEDPEALTGDAALAQDVIDRALAKWPANRFSSAQALANALWEAIPHQLDGQLRPTTPLSTASLLPIRTIKLGARLEQRPEPRPAVAPPPAGILLGQAAGRPIRFGAAEGPLAGRRDASGPKRFLGVFGTRRAAVAAPLQQAA